MQRKVRLFISMSLDGFIARKDGSVDWILSDQDYGYTRFYEEIDTVLMGRHTWEQLKAFGAYPYTGKAGVVFSHAQEDEGDAAVSMVTQPVEEWLTEARQREGGDFWLLGGARLFDACLAGKLVDEIQVCLHPVLLGDGVALFRPLGVQTGLELVESVAYPSGLVRLTYRRVN